MKSNGATISKGVGVGTITNDDVAVVDTPPTVTGSNITAARGQSFAASSLFTASDTDGDTITKYAFWDAGSGGGHFVLNGVAQGVSQEIDVTAAQLSQLSYQSGSGTDTLWVRANDGTQWSGWSNSFTVSAPIDSGPTVTPTNSEIKSFANQNFAVSSLFSYSDPFGSPATQYDFWNTGGGGGHFVLNGTALGANQHRRSAMRPTPTIPEAPSPSAMVRTWPTSRCSAATWPPPSQLQATATAAR